MKHKKSFTGKIIRNNLYAMKEMMAISKERVVFSIIKRLIEYLLWVFYSAFFVRFILDALEQEKALKETVIKVKKHSIDEAMRKLEPTDIQGLQRLMEAKRDLQTPGKLHISVN